MLIRIFSPTECGLIRDADLKKCGLNRMTTVGYLPTSYGGQLVNRVICKVRETQHQNPEFGHTQGEIQKKTCRKVH
jgi:hypothetical protein